MPRPIRHSNHDAKKSPSPDGEDRERPELLFLCQTLPYPPDGGVHIRTYNILRLLARAFNVTALCFYRRATRSSQEAVDRGVDGLREISNVSAFPIPQDHSKVRLIWDHVRSLVLRRVYTRFVYDSSEFRASLRRVLADRHFDVVHLDSLDLATYLPELSHLPVVCTHHNVESALLRRRAATEHWPLRPYMHLQADLMGAEERTWAGQVAFNAVVSHEDRELLRSIAPEARVRVVPNGVDTSLFQPVHPDEGDGIVFVGGHSWYPNRDGMAYFAEQILPHIRRTRPRATVTWVGRSPVSVQNSYAAEHGIHLTGFVDDIRPYVGSSSCYIVPLRVGGGTRLKILDAWAMGMPIVSTTVGCEGLEAKDGGNILIRDEPEAFADAVVRVLEDAALRRSLAVGARRTAERVYDWEIIGETMVDAYLTTARQVRPSAVQGD